MEITPLTAARLEQLKRAGTAECQKVYAEYQAIYNEYKPQLAAAFDNYNQSEIERVSGILADLSVILKSLEWAEAESKWRCQVCRIGRLKNPKAKFCGHNCRQSDYRARKAAKAKVIDCGTF